MSLLLRVADLNSVVVPPVEPPVVSIGGGAWWRKYRPVDLSRKRRNEIIDELVEVIEPIDDERVTVQEAAAQVYDYSGFGFSRFDDDFREALIRAAVNRVNAEIERRIEDEDDAFFLLN